MSDQRLAILGDLERTIMNVVWSRKEARVRDVVDALRPSRAAAYTTIMTVMNRLVDKGLLRRTVDGLSYRYVATRSKQEFLKHSSRQVVETFVKYYGELAIAQFIDVLDSVDPEKIAALKKRLRNSHDHGRGR